MTGPRRRRAASLPATGVADPVTTEANAVGVEGLRQESAHVRRI
jgi:hypothetical protein